MNTTQTQVWLLTYNPQIPLLPEGGWPLTSIGDQKRCAAIRHEDTRTQFALSRLLIKWVLNNKFGAGSRKWFIGYGSNGQPQLEAGEAELPDISISHTCGMVAFALTDKGPIGVDVENNSRRVDIQLISREVFSKDESAHFHTLSPAIQRNYFFQCWTLKEAYTKALGLGLYANFKSIEMEKSVDSSMIRLKKPATDDSYLPDTWLFYHDIFFSSFHIAIAQSVESLPSKTIAWQMFTTSIEIAGISFNAMRLSL